jgi:hypothetical protein
MNPNNDVGRLDCYEPVVVARGSTRKRIYMSA